MAPKASSENRRHDDERDRTGNTDRSPRGSCRARLDRGPLVPARRRRDHRSRRPASSLHRLTGLAAARGRDAAALRRPASARRALPGRARGTRRRAAALPRSRGRSRTSTSASKALRAVSARVRGREHPGRRAPARAARRTRARAASRRCSSPRAGCSSSTASTGGCTASSSSRARSRTSRCCARSSAAGGGAGRSGRSRSWRRSRRTPTGRSCSPRRASSCSSRAATGCARRSGRSAPSAVLGIPFWLTDLVLAGRFDVGVGGGGEKLGGPSRRQLRLGGGRRLHGRLPRAAGRAAGRQRPGCVRAPARDAACCGVRGAASRSRRSSSVASQLGLARDPPPDLRAALLRARRRGAGSRGSAAVGRRPRSRRSSRRRSPGRGTRRRELFDWEPTVRQEARADAAAYLAATSRPDDVLLRLRPALPRAPGSGTATSRSTSCPAPTPTWRSTTCSTSTGRSAAASGSSTRARRTTSSRSLHDPAPLAAPGGGVRGARASGRSSSSGRASRR